MRASNPKTGQVDDRPVIIGRIGSPHGVRGWARLYSFTTPQHNIFQYRPWMVMFNSDLISLTLENWRETAEHYLIKFENYTNRDHIKKLINHELYTWRSQFPTLKDDQYYWVDLQGLDVFNTQNHYLGRVDYLFATGANDVMVVTQSDNSILIPYIDQIIVHTDLTNGQLIVDWEA